jgi:Cdc6-like AAA superfamily ATPase
VAGRGYSFVAPVVREESTVRQESGMRAAPAASRAAAAPGAAQLPPVFHLPPRLSRMVGRGELVAELADRVRQRNFLTIVGPGGVGKTTVALALAEQLGSTYPDGARFVDLAAIADPSLVAGAAAASLDVQLFSGDPLGELLVHLRERQTLLVLDSCEHLIDAVAVLAKAVRGNAPGCISWQPAASRCAPRANLSAA